MIVVQICFGQPLVKIHFLRITIHYLYKFMACKITFLRSKAFIRIMIHLIPKAWSEHGVEALWTG